MKKYIWIGACLFIGTLTAQTKMIAHKSHSGSSTEFKTDQYTDNYGPIYEHVEEQKKLKEKQKPVRVTLLPDDCVKVEQQGKEANILCDHPYFTGQYTMDEIRAFYPGNTKFIGFERKFFNHTLKKDPKKSGNQKQKGIWWIFLPLVGLSIAQGVKKN